MSDIPVRTLQAYAIFAVIALVALIWIGARMYWSRRRVHARLVRQNDAYSESLRKARERSGQS